MAAPKSTFRSAVHTRLDKPLVSLFRVIQFAFALGSGISYAIELSHEHTSSEFIFAQLEFAITIITQIIDAFTLRSYRLTFLVESTICVLWLALFGVFYQIYPNGEELQSQYDDMTLGRAKTAVWLDLINSLLWLGSAVFSTVMCCAGTNGAIKWNLEQSRGKNSRKDREGAAEMESGVFHERPQGSR
ncbi:hypothetical protein DPSP01_009042 [Paraphaeosphaeria sporulosa]|uniref:MARVEL domain-containing protein n=1 Tax=Paraphaeosphaeria sporulosa TaxID=1460663 RepID=A0A177C9I0_9PLEO|nr:uncharacterized protein CC84DRAFT_1165626 [Paraphaeosphaeria sporulosa]OAG03380.1 hypothetical protein CC84DRAFT_1165626 [Paraphaeosphaeria sporulosa]